MTDPIDIESLDPLYRDVFRDPAKGTPDDISKAGCLALAKLGKEAWNAWRRKYPAYDDEDSGSIENYVDFSGVDFTIPNDRKQSFGGFDFGDWASFEKAIFPDFMSFHAAKFGNLASFSNATFGHGASFRWAQFGANAGFDGATFGELAVFNGATFFGDTSFAATTWIEVKPTVNDAAVGKFQSISFNGVKFLGCADFSKREFEGACSFSQETPFFNSKSTQVTVFKNAPKFFGCKLNQDTTFEKAIFPTPTGHDEAIRAYRCLKLAFSQQQAIREEQRFFKLEMAEEAARATGFQRILYKAYSLCSDYGFSIRRPAVLLAVTLAVMMLVYGVLSYLNNCLPDPNTCRFSTAWIEFSLLQSLPLPGLDKLSDTLRGQLFPTEGLISIGVTLAVILHKAISLLALFLMGLALRNLFKLK